MHPWHDIEVGKDFPKIVNAVVEISQNIHAKYKIDDSTGLLKFKEFLPENIRYPANYGFFPKTIASDKDGLDVFVFSQAPILSLTILEVRPLGGIVTESKRKGKEQKVIAVSTKDAEYTHIQTIEELPEQELVRLKEFLESYSPEDPKKFKGYLSKDSALQLLRASHSDYEKVFRKQQPILN